MIAPLIYIKTVSALVIFAGLALSVLFSGSSFASQSAYSLWKGTNIPSNSYGYVERFLKKIEHLYGLFAVTMTAFALSDMGHFNLFANSSFKIVFYLIAACLLAAFLSTVSNIIVAYIKNKATFISRTLIDSVVTIAAFVGDFARVQWQLLIVFLPWLFIRQLWGWGEYMISLSPLLALIMFSVYMILLYSVLYVLYERVTQRKMLYDSGVALSVVAITGLLLNDVDNGWTSIISS